ncbi:bifunctional DNA primase/polymerase [Mycobacterium sp. 1245801.1]|uniref:bifunctional DNA primase/polymerase n=1 Tax=Mycobacterium sp. 1245801.1 TaxID=1834075 RepID=UPI0007FB86D2|nr:bifunctional DNA primase/polymerase [Mycobacterium sp. 1245801.1]OBJ24630.1 hypothetical protein A5622_11685 [Mycobacterium sp. 1245801.1]
MLIHTTCATCRRELTLTYDAINNDSHRATHPGCPAAPKTQADKLFDNFAAMVARIAAPNYKPQPHDELNLTALQDKIDQLDQTPPRLGDAAAIYAQWGWPVFPLRPQQKVPAFPTAHPEGDPLRGVCKGECGKPGHGLYDATTDVDRIRAYWTANPNANIGIATGHAFDVIDVDLPDGPASWREIVAADAAPHIHGIVSTASDGRHFLTAPTGEGNKARMLPGIDYRGLGGYVVAPPSWLGDHGHKWTWISKPSPQLTERLNA